MMTAILSSMSSGLVSRLYTFSSLMITSSMGMIYNTLLSRTPFSPLPLPLASAINFYQNLLPIVVIRTIGE